MTDDEFAQLDREVEASRSNEPWRRDADWWFDFHQAPPHRRDPLWDGWFGLAIMAGVAAVFLFVVANYFGVWR